MKKFFFLTAFLFLFFLQSVFSQFQVTSFFNPVPGDRKINFFADTNNIYPGNGGANQTWNYSSLVFLNDSSRSNYVAASGTLYYSSFPTSTVASNTPINPSSFTYYKTSGSSFEQLGSHTGVYKTIFRDTKKWMQYPLSYGQSFLDSNISRVVNVGTNDTVQKNLEILRVTYDGYGTLTLPSGTVTNVARLRYETNSVDSMFFGGPPQVEYIADTTWAYYKSNYRFPVFQIEKSWMFMSGALSSWKGVDYAPNINSVGIKITNSEVPVKYKLEQNYPNPFNPTTTVRYSIPKESNVILRVYDRLGREIETIWNSRQTPGVYEVTWDAEKYSSGVYFYKITAGDYSETKQMMMIK